MGLVATPTHCSIKKGFKGHIIIVPNRAQNTHKASTVYLLIYRTLLITRTLFWAIFVVLIQRTLQCFNITFVLNIRTIQLSYIHHSQTASKTRLRVLQLDSFE